MSHTVIKFVRLSEIYLGVQIPSSYIGGKIPKLIVRDVFRNILRYSCAKKNTIVWKIRSYVLQLARWVLQPLDCGDILGIQNKKGITIPADNLPDKSQNLSSYIMECGSSEKFELLQEKFQLILRRTFFRYICYNIFMKQL